VPYEPGKDAEIKHVAHDTRKSASHPLRHSILNLTREVGESHNNTDDTKHNGSNYLLTSQMVFTTHEPCIMCSMALLHSRAARVAYLIPMERTGGCGGVTCLPKLESVNHRFGILRWRQESHGHEILHVDDFIDA
jgi:tRNA-specific adenosine deaminase 3